MNDGLDPMSALAQAYEAEDSQTMTSPTTKYSFKDQQSDSHPELSVEDTVIQNHDTYIDQLIETNKPQHPVFALSPQSTVKWDDHNVVFNKSLPPFSAKTTPRDRMKSRPSADFLMVVDNLQKQLNERNKEVGRLREQLKAKNSAYEKLLATNEELNEQKQTAENETQKKTQLLVEKDVQIESLHNEMNSKDAEVQNLTAEIEKYEQIGTWVELQMDKSVSMDRMNSLSIEKLKEWKQSIIDDQQDMFDNNDYDDDEKDVEQTQLLQNEKASKKRKKKKKRKKLKVDENKAEIQLEELGNNDGCCIPWFHK